MSNNLDILVQATQIDVLPQPPAIVEVTAGAPVTISGLVALTTERFPLTGGAQLLPLARAPATVFGCYLNGLLMQPTDYELTGPDLLLLSSALAEAGDNLIITYT